MRRVDTCATCTAINERNPRVFRNPENICLQFNNVKTLLLPGITHTNKFYPTKLNINNGIILLGGITADFEILNNYHDFYFRDE